MSGDVVGIVLVAGSSERLEGDVPKQLLPIGGLTMASVAVGNATASKLDRVIAVTGRAAGDVAASIAPGRAEIVHNAGYEQGNLWSLRTGLAAAGECGSVVVLLGDMPEVDPSVIDRMIETWRAHMPWAAVAVYDDGAPNHPFLLSAAALEHVRDVDGRKPLWRLLVDEPAGAVEHVVFHRRAPVDVDTMADYREVLRRLATLG